ncbi:MAG: hypothetical protein ACREFS_15865, partial [Acetobacteraceae bacterium]
GQSRTGGERGGARARDGAAPGKRLRDFRHLRPLQVSCAAMAREAVSPRRPIGRELSVLPPTFDA